MRVQVSWLRWTSTDPDSRAHTSADPAASASIDLFDSVNDHVTYDNINIAIVSLPLSIPR